MIPKLTEELFQGDVGFKINEMYMPPLGECHSRPLLPLPDVCISDITTVPSFSLIAICFALLFVESTSSKNNTFFPIISVKRILSNSNPVRKSGVFISLYPSFVFDPIS